MTAISAKEMLRRMQVVKNQSWLEAKVQQTVLSDQKALKEEKINEFTKGERPDGSKIGVYRDPEYAIFKQHINPKAGGYVDLMLMRNFTGGLFVRPFTKRSFLFDSSDSKTANLIGKYGMDIMGLNQDWFDKRQNDIYRLVLYYEIQKILNKK